MGDFTVSSAYNKINYIPNSHSDDMWKQIWNIKSPERIKVFMWLVAHNRLTTNMRIARWDGETPFCHHCQGMEEFVLSVLRDCPMASQIWLHLINYSQRFNFFMADMKYWIFLNLTMSMDSFGGSNWIRLWAHVCYYLWF